MLQSYRELVISLLFTAMLTFGLFPAAGPYSEAGLINAGGVLQAMETTHKALFADSSSAAAAFERVNMPAIKGGPVIMATLQQPQADPFQLLVAKAISINDSGSLDSYSTNLLGLTNGSETIDIYQIKAEAGTDVHYFNSVKDRAGWVILFSRINGVVYCFALNPQHSPTAALVKYTGQRPVVVTIDSVRPQLQQMLNFWMDWAEQNTSVARR